ncbi:MAG: peptidylprolyl isomerase [Clostridiales bacterium]|nr:peptidylprolyl isomerase [Clostridiales bacterium]
MTNPEIQVSDYPIATITMQDGRKIVLELYPEIAPESVKNFIMLANDGYYDGTIFHRVIYGFMIQGGCPEGTGGGGPGWNIKGEFSNNSVANDIAHVRGVLSMARQGNPYDPPAAYDTAGSQFFIVHKTSPHLDNDYAAFGRVIEGMDVVDEIASVTTDGSDKPRVKQEIGSIRVETFGVDYGEPNKLK